jgi:cardiolipin synthase A/B
MAPIYETFILVGNILGILFVPIVLARKRHPVSAIAWSLTVVFIPYFGILFFLVFGAFRIKRRLRRKLYHRSRFLRRWVPFKTETREIKTEPTWESIDQYTVRVGGSPMTHGNETRLYRDGPEAFKDKYEAIEAAKHHVHLEYFILRNDETGWALIELLCKKVSEGVQVRFLVDAVGSRKAGPLLEKLRDAGGHAEFFLPTRLLSSTRFTLGLRNHRKLLICDGKVGFIGGLNVGDEYLGKDPHYGYWRDTHMRVRGPAVLAMQRVFVEDWDFAAKELLVGDHYFPDPILVGDTSLQIVWSGPDQEYNAVREIYFAAITAARKRLWIATPYLILDGALLAGLRTAALRGVDVRILTQGKYDHWMTYWAGRYFWDELLACGVRIYQYDEGLLHSKVMIASPTWACVGSANMDIRSIRLNFEINCHIHNPKVVKELEDTFEADLEKSKQVIADSFSHRPLKYQLTENFCRLFSPLL